VISTPSDDDHDDADLADLPYRDAVAELESILTEIEDDAVDIDQLSRRVRRAAALIRLCQERILGARIEVERVVADLTMDQTDVAVDAPTDDELDEAADEAGDD
jgi:exodeoxyribonuclease VII small subunit